MNFNYIKFNEDANHSHEYVNWSPALVKVLEAAGCPKPTYDYHAHIFTLHIQRTPSKSGRFRCSAMVDIVCPDEGEIQIKPDKRVKLEELPQAIEKSVRFLSIMEKAGYVEV